MFDKIYYLISLRCSICYATKRISDMNIIGIETATSRLNAALITADGTVRERHTDSRSSHCELLTGFIMELTADAGITLNDIDLVAVSIGPGSFTGLRIGISTAMGLAYGLGVDTVPVDTLEAIAWHTNGTGKLVCPVIDARRREVYTALYRLTGGIPDIIHEPAAMPVIELSCLISGMEESCTVTGPAAPVFRTTLEKAVTYPLTFTEDDGSLPSAVSIAHLGKLHADRGEAIPPSELEPVYLRRSDAEIARATQCKSH